MTLAGLPSSRNRLTLPGQSQEATLAVDEPRTDIERIAARIRALLAKTVENGCTEGEALSAAAKAAEMLSRHDLTTDDVRERTDGFAQATHVVRDVVDRHLGKVLRAICDLCQVRYWTEGSGRDTRELSFFGYAVDVEIAGYLRDVVERAMRQARDAYDATQVLFVRSKRTGNVERFVQGMSDRLAEKVREIAWTRRPEATGNGLVVAKMQAVGQELAKRGVELESVPRRRYSSWDDRPEYDLGRQAGEGVTLDAAVDAPVRPAARLGRR